MKEPVILHIESATNVCSVAESEGEQLIGLRESDEDRAHSTMLTVFIEEALEQAGKTPEDLDAVCISKGPGSYTGLRIGVSVTKGIAYALGIPVIGLVSLEAMAIGALESPEVKALIDEHPGLLLCPMIDARRMEVFAAIYDTSMKEIRKVEADILDAHSYQAYLEKGKVLFFGNGSFKVNEAITHPNAITVDAIQPSAKNMIRPALHAFRVNEFEDTAYFEPFYLKDFVATVPRKKVL